MIDSDTFPTRTCDRSGHRGGGIGGRCGTLKARATPDPPASAELDRIPMSHPVRTPRKPYRAGASVTRSSLASS